MTTPGKQQQMSTRGQYTTMRFSESQDVLAFTERASVDVSHITRFLPSDLKYGAIKHHTLSAQLRAKESERNLMRSGSIGSDRLKAIDPHNTLQEKRAMRN